jgi:hypothetical protein
MLRLFYRIENVTVEWQALVHQIGEVTSLDPESDTDYSD